MEISLDCLTFIQLEPAEQIRVAAAAGYSCVSVWVVPPGMPGGTVVAAADVPMLQELLAETGLAVANLECFNINVEEDVIASYADALRIGAALGGRAATAIDYGDFRDDLPERFAAFVDLAASYGIRARFEPIASGNHRTLTEAAELIEASGAEAGVVFDVLHFVRTGADFGHLSGPGAHLIDHVQLCDGPAAVHDNGVDFEGACERLALGEGAFPLPEIVAALPAGVQYAIEVPSLLAIERGIAPGERAADLIQRAQRLL